jgi:hypothetical protein
MKLAWNRVDSLSVYCSLNDVWYISIYSRAKPKWIREQRRMSNSPQIAFKNMTGTVQSSVAVTSFCSIELEVRIA